MKEKDGIYECHTTLADVDGEYGRIDMNLAKFKLDGKEEIEVSYYWPFKKFPGERYKNHKTDFISFKEFQNRMLKDNKFCENVFYIYLTAKDNEITYGISTSPAGLLVYSNNMMKAAFVYDQLIL